MKNAILSISFICCGLVGASGANSEVTLYGQLYNGSASHGIYRFTSGEGDAMELVADLTAEPNCGAVKMGDRFYTFTAEAGDYGTEYSVYVYDVADDYQLVTRIGSAWSVAKPQQVLAVDPVSGMLYSVFQESGYYGTESYLGVIDLSRRTMTKVGSSDLYLGYGNVSVVAMTFSPEGELYAVASNSYLYKIDKETADVAIVGSTGIYPAYEQAMTFSPDGDTIYWAACSDNINALYSVDPATAGINKIKDFVNGEEFVTLWAGDIVPSDSAPGAPEGLTADFPGGMLTGTVSFPAPVTTLAGEALEGELTYEIFVDGKMAADGSATAGSTVDATVTVDNAGVHDFKVTMYSESHGIGGSAYLNGVYVGHDSPRQVENLLLSQENTGEFVITWDAPTEGAHGGFVDASTIKYRVRRLPDFEVLSMDAVSPFHDKYTSDYPVKCAYEVLPYINEEMMGVGLTTRSVMTGSPYETPYAEDFSSVDNTLAWTIDDVNDDGHTWDYQWDFGYFRIYDNDNAKDDWLISPYVRLESGNEYKLVFDMRTIASEELEVKAGLGLEPSELTVSIMKKELIPDTDYNWVTRECLFSCVEDGNYHFGFHAMTSDPSSALALYVDNVKVEKVGKSDGIAASAADSGNVISVDAGMVTALVDTALTVLLPDGRIFSSATMKAGDTMRLPVGMYIVSADGAAALKVLVK